MMIISFLVILSSCGTQKVTENVDCNTDGKLHCGYFYQDEGISLTTSKHFMESCSWNPVEFDYICQDMACTHKSDKCYANFISLKELLTEEETRTGSSIFSFKIDDKRIIIDTYIDEYLIEVDKETGLYINKIFYVTDVYESKPDGRDRRVVASFDGGIDASIISNAVVINNGKLYFGGAVSDVMTTQIENETGLMEAMTLEVEYAFYEIDLLDYSVRILGKTDGKQECKYTCQVYSSDDWTYLSRYNSSEEKGVWYAVNSITGECQEIAHFEIEAPRILGCIEDSVIAYRNNILFQYDWMKKEMKELYCGSEDKELIAFVLADEIWIATDKSLEKDNNFVEYTILDIKGNILRNNHYSDYITFLDVIGDRVLYLKPLTEGIEEWWCELDKVDTLENSVYIGNYFGRDME